MRTDDFLGFSPTHVVAQGGPGQFTAGENGVGMLHQMDQQRRLADGKPGSEAASTAGPCHDHQVSLSIQGDRSGTQEALWRGRSRWAFLGALLQGTGDRSGNVVDAGWLEQVVGRSVLLSYGRFTQHK